MSVRLGRASRNSKQRSQFTPGLGPFSVSPGRLGHSQKVAAEFAATGGGHAGFFPQGMEGIGTFTPPTYQNPRSAAGGVTGIDEVRFQPTLLTRDPTGARPPQGSRHTPVVDARPGLNQL